MQRYRQDLEKPVETSSLTIKTPFPKNAFVSQRETKSRYLGVNDRLKLGLTSKTSLYGLGT
jgi:hypothetical protein